MERYLLASVNTGSYGRVAHEWGVGESAVRVMIHRLRRRLCELLRVAVVRTACISGEVEKPPRCPSRSPNSRREDPMNTWLVGGSVKARMLLVALGSLVAALSAEAAEVRTIANFRTRDLVYDPDRQRIWASVVFGSNSSGPIVNCVAPIDPVTGDVGPAIPLGGEPGKLALSDDGRYLYVSVSFDTLIHRVDLETGAVGAPFVLGVDQFGNALAVDDMDVQPGHAEVLAVARRSQFFFPRHYGVAIYKDGIALPNRTPSQVPGSNTIAFSDDEGRLYGYSTEGYQLFSRMTVDADGVMTEHATNVPLGCGPTTAGRPPACRCRARPKASWAASGAASRLRSRAAASRASSPSLDSGRPRAIGRSCSA